MSVPLVSLPSLDLVRGFVAVGRRMSMTQAADDLCVSQSAISKQVRSLEAMLGVRLLVRGHRSIAFTPEGERFFAGADLALQQLQNTTSAVTAAELHRPVTITASIGVAGLWLLPRLGKFQKKHPGIDVRVAASNAMLDLRAESVDLAIRYCATTAAPPGATRLFGETVAPVASPSLGLQMLASQRALANQFLLEFDDARPWLQWKTWLASRQWDDARPKGILRFNQYDQLIQSAVSGQGIALGRLELLTPLLAEGRLVALETRKPEPPASDHAYWLVQADERQRPDVASVAHWIKTESKALA